MREVVGNYRNTGPECDQSTSVADRKLTGEHSPKGPGGKQSMGTGILLKTEPRGKLRGPYPAWTGNSPENPGTKGSTKNFGRGYLNAVNPGKTQGPRSLHPKLGGAEIHEKPGGREEEPHMGGVDKIH